MFTLYTTGRARCNMNRSTCCSHSHLRFEVTVSTRREGGGNGDNHSCGSAARAGKFRVWKMADSNLRFRKCNCCCHGAYLKVPPLEEVETAADSVPLQKTKVVPAQRDDALDFGEFDVLGGVLTVEATLRGLACNRFTLRTFFCPSDPLSLFKTIYKTPFYAHTHT